MIQYPKLLYISGVRHKVNSAEEEQKLLDRTSPVAKQQSSEDDPETVPEKKAKKAKK